MLTKSWDEENAPAAMMMRELSGRHLFKFIRFQMIADRKGYTARDLANDYGYNTTQVNRFLDGKLPADDPAGKTLSVFLKTMGIGR